MYDTIIYFLNKFIRQKHMVGVSLINEKIQGQFSFYNSHENFYNE